MNAPAKLSTIEQIRARDGEDCWLCGFPLDFSAAPNSKKAPTKEHLLAQSLGGTNELANLVLCHPGCNKQLGTRPIDDKRAMQRKVRANRAKLLAGKAMSPTAPASKRPVDAKPPVVKVAAPSHGEAEVAYWRRLALAAGATAAVSVGYVAGLITGLILN